ncbi:MAG: hypothetical protein AAF288_09140 [Planctomycetota bacterium]
MTDSPEQATPTPDPQTEGVGSPRPDLNLAKAPEMTRSGRARRPRAKRSRKAWLGLFLVGGAGALVAAVGLAPAALSTQAGQKYALKLARSAAPGDLQFDRVELGWFSPTRLHGLDYLDTQAGFKVSVDSVLTNRSLSDLLLSRDLGVIEAQGVQLDLTLPRQPKAKGEPPRWPADLSGSLAVRELSVRLPAPTPDAAPVLISARTLDIDARDPQNLQVSAAGDVLQARRRGAFALDLHARGLVSDDGLIQPFKALFEADIALQDVPTQAIDAAAGSDLRLAAWIGPSVSLDLSVSGALDKVATEVSFEAERAGGKLVLVRDGQTVRVDDDAQSSVWLYATPASERAARGGEGAQPVLQAPVTVRLAINEMTLPATGETGVDWPGARLSATLKTDGPVSARLGENALRLDPFEVEVFSASVAQRIDARLRTLVAVDDGPEAQSRAESVVVAMSVTDPLSQTPKLSIASADAPLALVDRLLGQDGKLVAAVGATGEVALDVRSDAALAPDALSAWAYRLDWQSPLLSAVVAGRALQETAGWSVDVRTDPDKAARWQPLESVWADIAGIDLQSRGGLWLAGVQGVELRLDPSVLVLGYQEQEQGERKLAWDASRSQLIGVVRAVFKPERAQATGLASAAAQVQATDFAAGVLADVRLDYVGGVEPGRLSLTLDGLLAEDGGLTPRAVRAKAVATGQMPSSLLEALADKPWVPAALGPVVRIETFEANRLAEGAWKVDLSAWSERSKLSVRAEGQDLDTLQVVGGSSLEIDPTGVALEHLLRPLNPLLTGVVDPTQRVKLTVGEGGLSLDAMGGALSLAQLSGGLDLDLGSFRFDRSAPLGSLAALLTDFGVEQAQSISLPEYRLQLKDGRASLDGAAIELGGWSLPIDGGWDLASGRLQLVVEVPADALAKAAPAQVAGFLPEDLMLRVPLGGTTDSVGFDPSAFRAEIHRLWTRSLRQKLLESAGVDASLTEETLERNLLPPGIAGETSDR